MKIEWQDYGFLVIFWCMAISLLAENPHVKIGFSIAELVIMLIILVIKEKEFTKEEKEEEDDDNN